jgi:hypothetical protein
LNKNNNSSEKKKTNVRFQSDLALSKSLDLSSQNYQSDKEDQHLDVHISGAMNPDVILDDDRNVMTNESVVIHSDDELKLKQ